MKARQVIVGMGWGSLSTAVNLVAQLVVMAILARHLDAAAFGLMLMAVVATRFATFFAQMGTAQALVQRPEFDAAFATALLVIGLLVSSLLYLAMLVSAPLFGWYFESPELPALLQVFALSLPLTALSGLPLALLRRRGRFRDASLVDSIGFVVGYGATGVAAALADWGVWSLVAATLGQQLLTLVLGFLIADYPRPVPISRALIREVMGTGARYSLVGFFEFLHANVESLLTGRLLGSTALGLLNRAQVLATLPVEQVVTMSTKVLFPALSAMQSDRSRLGDGFMILFAATGLLSVPIGAGMAAASADVVLLMLGPAWKSAEPILAVLALGVPLTFAYVVCGLTLDGMGAVRPKLILQVTVLIVKATLLMLVVHLGMVWVVWGIVACEVMRTVAGLWLISSLLNLDRRLVLRLVAGMLLIGLCVHASVATIHTLTLEAGWRLPLRMCAQIAGGAAVSALFLGLAAIGASRFAPLQRFESLRIWQLRLVGQLPRFRSG